MNIKYGKKERPFDKLYAELEDIRDARGNLINTVLFSKNGNWSVILEIENSIQQYSTDTSLYYAYTDILNNIIQTLGEGYCIQKQDIFCKQGYNREINDDMNFLYKSYFKYFRGREYTNIRTFLLSLRNLSKVPLLSMIPKYGWIFIQRSAK